MTTRREFLDRFAQTAGCFVATASLPALTGCARDAPLVVSPGISARFSFPQGVASADPQPDAVVLWTRIVDGQGTMPITFTVQVATTDDFSRVVVEESLTADSGLDFTVRCFVDGLAPNRWYWYRFVTPDGFASRVGRTHTAPEADTDAQLNLAVFSCQNYEHGYFSAYRQLMLDDSERPEAERVQLCLHVGDYIYENVGWSQPGINGEDPVLRNADGSLRRIEELPSGGRRDARGQLIPVTVEDYRYIYREYLRDESLLEARARYPFICIWDDHEVINDYWQSYGPNGPMQREKLAANQAWFEYIPAALDTAPSGPAGFNRASDFEIADVENIDADALDTHYLNQEQNNLAAIGSLTIYRALHWGRAIDLFLVDGRSYRGERGVDNSLLTSGGVAAYPSAPLNPNLVHTLNAGRTANGGDPPATVNVFGTERTNPRRDAPFGSLLGEEQKQWLKDSLEQSTARWKILCNDVPMMRFGFDNAFQPDGDKAGLFFTDSWDGYPVERNELMEFVLDSGIRNVVSLAGDRHANFAGLVYDDYDADAARPAAIELAGTSVSAACRFRLLRGLLWDDPDFGQLTRADGQPLGYPYDHAPVVNGWMLHGAQTARTLSGTFDVDLAVAAADPDVNPHLIYADNDAYGYFRVSIDVDSMRAEFVVLAEPVDDPNENQPVVRRRVFAEAPARDSDVPPTLTNIRVEGEMPLLGIKG